MLGIWGGGGILFPPLQTQTQTLRAARAAGGKKKTKQQRTKTNKSCMIIHKTLEIKGKMKGPKLRGGGGPPLGYVRMYVCMYVCMYVRTYVRMYVRT